MAWVTGFLAAMLAAPPLPTDPSPPPTGNTAAVDYARPASWICRPGTAAQGEADDTCGARPDAAEAALDCFYVYPTTSDDPTFHSDLRVDGSERGTVRAQAAPLARSCRLFVPAYHQVTRAGLRWQRRRPAGETIARINAVPYRDVAAAWASYLRHDNGGRGVVLVGHSQGAILLKRLLRREIDGRPAQRLLAGAYLAGNPDLGTASLPHIPPCRARGQTGCLVAWSSYPAGYTGPRAFGGTRDGAPLCVDPAAPGGGPAPLRPIPFLGAADGAPGAERLAGPIVVECVADAQGAVLRVAPVPGPLAERTAAALARMVADPGWGLHPRDLALVEGDLVDDIAAQARAWAGRAGQAAAGSSLASPPR